ncbi:hypothetical protein Acsp02_64200 [Actinoplanes sp. NBRC 103695]|nr:hypothetical protein Acsp02_64200 [Actinoplanes sp. NBRC 103695]
MEAAYSDREHGYVIGAFAGPCRASLVLRSVRRSVATSSQHRMGGALGFEDGSRRLDVANEELHVVQQLRYSPREYGGFYLTGLTSTLR